MASKADFRLMVVSHLGLLDETAASVPPEMARRIDLWIDGTRAQLLERGLCWWDEADIPDAVTIPLSQYVAARACKAFGRGGKGFEADKDTALREIAGLKSTAELPPIAAKYY